MLFNRPLTVISNGGELHYPNISEGGGRSQMHNDSQRQRMFSTPFDPISPTALEACEPYGAGFLVPSTATIRQTEFLPIAIESLGFQGQQYGCLEDRNQLISSMRMMVPPSYSSPITVTHPIWQRGMPIYTIPGSGRLGDPTYLIRHPAQINMQSINHSQTDPIPLNWSTRRTRAPSISSNPLGTSATTSNDKLSFCSKRQRHCHMGLGAAESNEVETLGLGMKGNPETFDGLEGERRLIIEFHSFGTKGRFPQTFGKRPVYIPDGLVGTHTAYDEVWKFEIHHTSQFAREGSTVCCLTWRITNVKSGDVIERTETPDEAEARSTLGWTIASKTFREALHQRANQLEEILAQEKNSTRLANLKSLTRTLRPKTFTQGPLVFGLKHRIVQEKLMLV